MQTDVMIARSLTWRYVIALVLVAMLATAAWLSLYLVVTEQQSTAAIVNISGRQRMLSQRTALLAFLLVKAPPEARPEIRGKLGAAVELMRKSHQGLTRGDAEMGLPAGMSDEVRTMYFAPPLALDTQVKNYLTQVGALLEAPESTLLPDNPLLQTIIADAPTRLLASLDKMVSQYQREGEASVSSLHKGETIVWLLTLLLLAIEAAFIFRPIARHIRVIVEKLHGVTERLRRSQNELEARVLERTEALEEKGKELADSEEKFRLISTSAKDAILIIDTEETVTYWNPAATAMFGYPQEAVLGRNMHELLAPPRYREDSRRGFAQFRQSGSGPVVGHTIEMTALRKDGEEFPIELSISSLRIKGRLHALGIIRDISERKQSENELKQHRFHLESLVAERTTELTIAKEAAEAANRAKSTFLANMSHELRTPMNAIMGMTVLALRRAEDPKLKDQLGKIDQASKHLLHVINDILDISKIEAERLTLEQTPFRLGEVLEKLLSMIGQKSSDKGLKLFIDLPAGLPGLPLVGDPTRLGQILLNLAGNAVKFTESGSVTLRARLLEDTEDDILLRWEVADTGIGISAEDQPRLFTAFEQADGSMTRKYGGTGLGLAISKRLVQLMGGEIGVESTPGQGSTAWFTARLGKGEHIAKPVEPGRLDTLLLWLGDEGLAKVPGKD